MTRFKAIVGTSLGVKMNTEKIVDLVASPQEIIDHVSSVCPEIEQLLFDANIIVHKYKGSMQPYQAAVLYMLAKEYNYSNVLEIGTGVGYSTYFLTKAAPQANIITINPNADEMKIAGDMFYHQKMKATFLNSTSRHFWSIYDSDNFDFIFVDGDHKDIQFDLKWIGRLNENGCILFHDYSDDTSKSPCLPVYNALTAYQHIVGDFSIYVRDTVNNFGMAGWFR